jgi:pimeloyl-ACP methyl ester carboxylesterase
LIRRAAIIGGLLAVPAALARLALRRGTDRLLAGQRVTPEEAGLGPAVDALGGEIVRLRSRDGLRLAGRWLPAEPGSSAGAASASAGAQAGTNGPAPADAPATAASGADDRVLDDPGADAWWPDPHEAILLLHGWSGSIVPDLVEYGPLLRRTAGVLGLDFRGHGDSDEAATTFGLHEVEDVAGALAWFGERGISRVALVGTSMGGITALAAVAVLGDGSLPAADIDPDAPAHDIEPPRPRIVGAVVESVPAELTVAVGNRLRWPFRRFVAARLFEAAGRRVGGDLRATEPIRIAALLENVPVLLINGSLDRTVPPADGRRLAAAIGPLAESWLVPAATHAGAHTADPRGYEERVGGFLRRAFVEARSREPIIGRPVFGQASADGEVEGD